MTEESSREVHASTVRSRWGAGRIAILVAIGLTAAAAVGQWHFFIRDDAPSAPIVLSVDDDGTIEFQLYLTRVGL